MCGRVAHEGRGGLEHVFAEAVLTRNAAEQTMRDIFKSTSFYFGVYLKCKSKMQIVK